MSNVSKTLGEVMKAEREAAVVKEKAEQELRALQEKLKAATVKMLLLKTHQIGSPSGAQISQQDDSVEKEQRELTKDVSAFATPKGTSEQGDETGGNDAKTNPESPADESGNTLQSAGISDGIVEGNTADSFIEPAAGKDVESPQPAEVHGTTVGETDVSSAASEQRAGAADKNAVCESGTDREELRAVSGSVNHAQPIHSADTTGVGEEFAARVLSIPIYTDKDILALL